MIMVVITMMTAAVMTTMMMMLVNVKIIMFVVDMTVCLLPIL